MWTPKRLLLLVLGFVLFSLAYGVYAYFLGGVDGLPPLPSEYAEVPQGALPDTLPTRTLPELDRKLKIAFGDECEELKRKIKLEMRTRGIVLAADTFTIEPDGRVKLEPFSVVLFGKERGEGQVQEINTVQSDIAYLRFDQRITNIADMASRKIVGGELVSGSQRRQSPNSGGVTIRNNRRTAQPDDDLTLTTRGPVYYEESQLLIWSKEFVRIVDEQNKDGKNPTIIEAVGMDVYLTSETDDKAAAKSHAAAHAGGKPAAARKDKLAGNISGVKALKLRSDVDMRLYVDARSGFMASPAKPAPEAHKGGAAPTTPADPAAVKKAAPHSGKDLVHIKTQGPFLYDLLTDRARFDVSEHPGGRPNSVEVVRRTGPGAQGACDQLDCEHLTLQFRRKDEAKEPGPVTTSPFGDGRSSALEIESAHAWGSNNQVTLTSDAEVLAAYGNDLVYDARSRQTILKGSPEMIALKDGNEIRARELLMISAGDKEAQQARIKGPGRVEMLDSATKERTLRARFRDQLISGKEGLFDVLILTGDAAFEELEPGQQLQAGQEPKLRQRLQADRLKVWLLPAPVDAVPTTADHNHAGKDDSQRRRPHHVEAIGQVSASSPDMTVHDTEKLVIVFKDAPPGRTEAPGAAAVGPPAPGPKPAGGDHLAQKPAGTGTTTTNAAAPSSPAGAAEKPKRPIDLSARRVEAHVMRYGTHNDLEKLWCEGAVHVRQAPEHKDDKGVDITGQTLQLLKFVEGHVLTVTGSPAEVQLDRLTIWGPEVNIDQKENKAWVVGLGVMRLPSNAQFGAMQGNPAAAKQAKPTTNKPTELTVHWTRDMFFDGRRAVYHGGVQAEQDNSRLTCLEMQVFLDKFVSLKEGDRSGTPAKVENLVCDKSVRVEDVERVDGKLLRYQRIESIELSFNNEDGVLVAPGPGVLRILQLGPKDEAGPANASSAKPQPKKEKQAEDDVLKLTRINFLGRMFANNNSRTAVFYDSVEVVHVPTDNPDLSIDVDKLPEGALYLKCDQLKVYNRPTSDGKADQQMEARGHAAVQSQEFWGRADVIKFDESKELVVFEANEGNLATLVRQKAKGTAQEELKGKKIYYWRRTNDFKIEGGTGARVIQ